MKVAVEEKKPALVHVSAADITRVASGRNYAIVKFIWIAFSFIAFCIVTILVIISSFTTISIIIGVIIWYIASTLTSYAITITIKVVWIW